MKLFLSSYHLGNEPKKLSELYGENKRVVVIVNANDFRADRDVAVEKAMEEMRLIGLSPTEVDLRNYFDRPHELATELEQYGGVWVIGGNVFMLRRAMQYSGMDAWVTSKVSDPTLVYGGYSAGVCLLGQDLHGLELVDDKDLISEGYKSEIVWEGLGLLPYTIVPHYRSNHPESERVERVVEYMVENKLPHKTMRDGEVEII